MSFYNIPRNSFITNYEIIKDHAAFNVILHLSAKTYPTPVLLPYFSDNLKRDDESGTCIITRTMIKEKGKKK